MMMSIIMMMMIMIIMTMVMIMMVMIIMMMMVMIMMVMMMTMMMMIIVMMAFSLTQAKMISLFCIFCYVLYTDCSSMSGNENTRKKNYRYLRITLRQPVKKKFRSLLDLIATDFILRDKDKNYYFGEFMEIYYTYNSSVISDPRSLD